MVRPAHSGVTTKFTRSRTRTLAVLAAVALLSLSLSAGVALADGGQHGDGGRNQGSAQNTFTKYVTTWPAMAGVVGGDVGAGTFAGKSLRLPSAPLRRPR